MLLLHLLKQFQCTYFFTIYSKIVKFCETKNLSLRREKLYKVERERKREREQELKIKHKYFKMKHFQHNYLKIKHLLLFCFFFFVVYLLLCFWKNESWNTSWINICCLNFSISKDLMEDIFNSITPALFENTINNKVVKVFTLQKNLGFLSP